MFRRRLNCLNEGENMKGSYFLRMALCGLFILSLLTPSAYANKSGISIEAPAETAPGSTITIKLNVTHKGNSGFHFTRWVSLQINGTEVKRWKYKSKERPETENFTVTFSYTVEAPIEIVAKAKCNIHGSEGPKSFKVDVKQ